MTKSATVPVVPLPTFDSLEQQTYLALWKTYDSLKVFEDQLFGRHGISAQQYNALRLLHAATPDTIPVLTLGQQLISRAPDMTRLLDRLETRGYIVRQRRAENRRVVDVGITSAGIKLLDELAEPVRQCHQQQLGHLSESQLRQINRLLAVVRAPHTKSPSSGD